MDALIEACGGNPEQTGRMAFKAHAVALADIKEVCPELTKEDIARRASLYKSKHPQWDLTTTALAKWWDQLGGGKSTRAANADIYVEPSNWRPVLKQMYDLSEAAAQDKTWLDLSPLTRKDILTRINQ